MGIFSSNKEILSMLEDFKREADKRICRLEAIAKKSKSESMEMLADIKAYCEEANGNAIISDVLDLMQTSNKIMKSFNGAMLEMNEKINSISSKLGNLGSGSNTSDIKGELQALRSDLKKAVATYEFIRKNKDVAACMAFFRSENGDGTLFDESQEQLTQIETINKNSEMGKSEYEKIKKDIMAEVESKIEDALVEMHSANMSLYWELMKLLDSDRLVFKYVASFLASVVHLSRLDDKDACERGVKALADKLSSINKVIKVDDSDFNMVRQLAADIEEYDERLRPELDVILAWINTNGD